MSQLVPCPSCQRHVRCGEGCPFCGADPVEAPPTPVRPVGRLGRAALFAFGATMGVGALTSGCFTALYGAPAPDDAGVDAAEVMEDSGAVAPAYGAPAPDGG